MFNKDFQIRARKYQDSKELGYSFLNSGSYSEALDKLEEAIQLCPSNLSNADAHYGIPHCYLGLKQYDKVLQNAWWRNKEEELYLKAIASIESGRKIEFVSFIEQGINVNFELFKNLTLKHIDIYSNPEEIIQFLHDNTILQIIRNIELTDLKTSNPETKDKLKKIKKYFFLQDIDKNQFSIAYLINESKQIIKNTSLDKLFSKECLFLDSTSISYFYNSQYLKKELIVYDLSFLMFFTKLKAVCLTGQYHIRSFKVFNHLKTTTEINVSSTNFKVINFDKFDNINIIQKGRELSNYKLPLF